MTEEKDVIAVQVFETVEAKVAADIERFDVRKEQIEKVRLEIEPLTINGPDDKAGAAAVWKAVTVAKDMRISVEKKRKELKEDSLKYGKAIDAYAKELTALIEPIEAEARKKYEQWEADKAAIEAAKEKEAQAKLLERVKAIIATGADFDGLNYTLAEAEISQAEVKHMADNDYNGILASFQVIAERLAKEKAEAERIEKEAEDARQLAIKQEADRLAEQKRLQDEQAERMAKQLADIEEAQQKAIAVQADIEKQKAQLLKEQNDLLLNNRIAELEKLGLYQVRIGLWQYSTEDFSTDTLAKTDNLLLIEAPAWKSFIDFLKVEIEKAEDAQKDEDKRKADEKAIKERTEARGKQLEGLGMAFDTLAAQWAYKTKDFGNLVIGAHAVLDIDEDEFGYRLSNISADIAEIKQKQAAFDLKQQQEAEALQKEKEANDEVLKAQRLNDRITLSNWLDLLPSLPDAPTFTTQEYIDKYQQFYDNYTELLEMLF